MGKDLEIARKPDACEITVTLANRGLGTMRSAGTYIGLLLQTERPADRVSILADVMETLGITPEEVSDRYYASSCKTCGMSDSPLLPCECHDTMRGR
jgi:hypothetical protein